MQVALFVHRFPPAVGGAEAYTARLCDYLLQSGDSVHVWTTTAIELTDFWYSNRARSGPSFAEQSTPIESENFRIRRFQPLYFPLRRYFLKGLSLIPIRSWQCLTVPCNPICPRMLAEANSYDGRLDAVHACAFPYSFPIWCGLKLARRRNVPFYVTPFLHLGDLSDPRNSIRKRYTKHHLRWLLLQADGVFVQTHSEQQAVIQLGVEPHNVHLHGLGVDIPSCTNGNRTRIRYQWGVRPDEVVIGHLANNSKEKGTIDLLKAAKRAWHQGHRFKIVLAGPEMPNFQRFWERFGPATFVKRLGILSDPERRDFFAGIDCFALPSHCDSFGLVLLEAWANQKPNLVYHAGGPGELIRHGIDGLVARCGDLVDLTQQLIQLIEQPSLRRKLGLAGYARVQSEFSWSDKLAFVRSVLTGNPAQAPLPFFKHNALLTPAARLTAPGCPIQNA